MNPRRTFRRSATPATARTATIRRMLADAREKGRPEPSAEEIASILAIHPERVRRHLAIIGGAR